AQRRERRLDLLPLAVRAAQARAPAADAHERVSARPRGREDRERRAGFRGENARLEDDGGVMASVHVEAKEPLRVGRIAPDVERDLRARPDPPDEGAVE